MLKHTQIVLIFIVLAVTASMAFAGSMPPGPMKQAKIPFGKWWRHPSTVENLNLTQAEIDRLDTAFDDRARTFMELKHAVELKQFDLEKVMSSDPLDESAIMTQFNALESARATLSKERFQYYLEVRKILGSERFQKIKTFRKRMHQQEKGSRNQKKKATQQ